MFYVYVMNILCTFHISVSWVSYIFNSLAMSRYSSFFSLYTVVSREGKVHHFASSLVLLIIIRSGSSGSGRLAEIRWSVCMSKSQRSLCVPFSRRDVGLGIYNLFVLSNFNFIIIIVIIILLF